MSVLARHPLGAVPYAGDGIPQSVPGTVIPPPIPGGTTAYYVSSDLSVLPYAWGGLAGGRPPMLASPVGGIVVVPDPAAGVMRLRVWWPGLSALNVIRISARGREYVRGGYGRPVAGTRTNWCPNPSFEAGANGYVPNVGNPVITSITDPAATLGSKVGRAVNAAAGSSGVIVPVAAGFSPGGGVVTIAADVRLATQPTGLRVVVSWTDSGGASLGNTTNSFTSDDIVRSVSQFGRQVAVVAPPAGAVTATIGLIADGMPAGGVMDLDGVTIETGATGGARFDGGVLGGSWVGVVGLSASRLADVAMIVDSECPLDEPVTYQVADPSIGGGTVLSQASTLASLNRSWLTHPSRPETPVRVSVRRKPGLKRPLPRGVFRPLGRRNAVSVYAARRQSPEWTMEINALTGSDYDTLLSWLDDGAPVLLRAPGSYRWYPRWMSLGDLDDDPEGRLGWQDAWLLSAPAVEVDAPALV